MGLNISYMEINSSPSLKGIEKASQIDVAGKIIEYVAQNFDKTH